ncbi:MAG: dipeptide ABC transporter ATP-binding protein [Granulosicoccus sp.]
MATYSNFQIHTASGCKAKPNSTFSRILDVQELTVEFRNYGQSRRILNNVSLHVCQGERVALIGQSGSGKSVTMRSIIGTLPMPPAHITAGSIRFKDDELLTLGRAARNRIKGTGISIVLQDPLLSFNPVLSIGRQMDDVVKFADQRLGNSRSRGQRHQVLLDTLGRVQLPDGQRILDSWPMMLSGGMRQRVLIALALLNNPSLLIADEPGTALDVTTQQEILDLLNKLVRDEGLSLLLITHNLGVVREMADRIYVMQRGEIVESGLRDDVLRQPEHAYTIQLMDSVPPLYGSKTRTLVNTRSTEPLFELQGVSKRFTAQKRFWQRGTSSTLAVDNVSLTINRGDVFGIAGESGSGKTTVARMLLGLQPASSGQILFHGLPLSKQPGDQQLWKRVQIVFQNPGSSLNPRRSVRQHLEVPLRFSGLQASDSQKRIHEILERVDLPASYASMYPHELSGGQKQRVAIARALCVNPEVIVLDEPTSALDVLVQNTVIDLLRRLRNELNLTYVFISHDLSLMRNFANRVTVMYRGKICEHGEVESVFNAPEHPYTRALLSSIPVLSETEAAMKPVISSEERLAVLASSTTV